jgi:hypothetical protein
MNKANPKAAAAVFLTKVSEPKKPANIAVKKTVAVPAKKLATVQAKKPVAVPAKTPMVVVKPTAAKTAIVKPAASKERVSESHKTKIIEESKMREKEQIKPKNMKQQEAAPLPNSRLT